MWRNASGDPQGYLFVGTITKVCAFGGQRVRVHSVKEDQYDVIAFYEVSSRLGNVLRRPNWR